MLRELRKRLAEQTSILMLLDIPWSKSGAKPDVLHPTVIGQFHGLSTISRLLPLIDQDFKFVYAERISGDIVLKLLNADYVDDAYRLLGELIQRNPSEYERLSELHKFFSFESPKKTAIQFNVSGEDYILSAEDMGAWRVSLPEPLATLEKDRQIGAVRGLIQQDIDDVILL